MVNLKLKRLNPQQRAALVLATSLGISTDEQDVWLRQAKRRGSPAAWPGVDRCDQLAKGRSKCVYERTVKVWPGGARNPFYGKPHRHCECGLPIDTDHGYCDECIARLIDGCAMTDYQSHLRREDRIAWLLKYDFVVFDKMGLHVR